MVRGQEYYTDTVFEVDASINNNTEIIAGGGRYDSLVQRLLGHKFIKIPATGFACSIERILNIIKDNGISTMDFRTRNFIDEKSIDYVIFPKNIKRAWGVARRMRRNWIRVDLYLSDNKKENAKQYAKKKGATFLEV